MIVTIARKEMTEMMRDGRFRWTAGLVFALLAGAVALGWQHYRDVSSQHETARRLTREQWLRQGAKNPHGAAHYGVYAFKPKLPLSLVDRGVDPMMGVTAWLEAHKQNEFKYRPAQDATAVQRLGELTGAAVLQLLLPLVIVLLTFSAFAGEREQGTLRQLLSLGVKRRDLALGKALGIAGALGAVLLPAAILGAAALTLAADNGALAASLPRAAGMTLSYLLYFAAFLAGSLAVSAWAKSARLALVALLAFWTFNGLIAPRAVADLAKRAHPTPSAFEFTRQIDLAMKSGFDGHDTADRRMERLRAELLTRHKVDRLDQLPVNFSGIALQAGEEHGNEVFDRYYRELWDTFRKQERIHQAASVLAPVLAVRSLSMAFAGTDFSQHAHFARAAEDYRRLIQRVMNEDIARGAVGTKGPYLAGDGLWAKVPDFEYTAPDVSWVLGNQSLSLMLLAAWSAAAVWAALRTAAAAKAD